MKKLLSIGLALGLSLQFASALTQVFTVAAGTAWNATNFFTFSGRINSITISTGTSGGATNLVYALIDAPTNNAANGWGLIMNTNSGFMGTFSTNANITRVTTNISGFKTTNTGVFKYTYTNYVGATSNAWRRLVTGTVGSNSTATAFSSDAGSPVIFGLGFTNNNIGKDITLTVDYNPSL